MPHGKKILIIVGDYVEDYEAMVPYQSLLAYGFRVDAVCPGKQEGDTVRTAVHDFVGDQTYSEKTGHNFALNATFSEVDSESYDALVIPGGRSPEYLSVDPAVIALVKEFEAARKPIASICHGQLILAAANVLQGKKATAYPALKPVLLSAGAVWEEPSPISACFVDTEHKLVTGAAWPGHPEFLALLLMMLGATVEGADKRVLLLCGDYMEDYEAIVPFQSLLALSFRVDAVCPGKKSGDTVRTTIHDFEGDQTYSEKPGHNFALTASFSDISSIDEYDALVIPGGRSPEYLSLNNRVLEIVREFEAKGKVIASICHGQQILAAADVLKGKKCTAYPGVKPTVLLAGGEWQEPEPISRCFSDGNLITGAAWPAHPEFVSLLLKKLGTKIVC